MSPLYVYPWWVNEDNIKSAFYTIINYYTKRNLGPYQEEQGKHKKAINSDLRRVSVYGYDCTKRTT